MVPSNNYKLIRENLTGDTIAWDKRSEEDQKAIRKLMTTIRNRSNCYYIIQFNLKGGRDLMGKWPTWAYPARFHTPEDAWDFAAYGITQWPLNARSLSIEKVYDHHNNDIQLLQGMNVEFDPWPFRR